MLEEDRLSAIKYKISFQTRANSEFKANTTSFVGMYCILFFLLIIIYDGKFRLVRCFSNTKKRLLSTPMMQDLQDLQRHKKTDLMNQK